MQLDLFTHTRDVMLQNDVIAALNERNALTAQQALGTLAAEFSKHEMVAPMTILLNTLTTPMDRFADHQAAAARLHAMQNSVTPAANRVLGNAGAARWLAPLWQSLANAAAGLPFNVKAPNTHAAYMLLQSGDWAAAEAATARIPSWRRIPASLAWMAQARFYQGGLDQAWCLLVELAWIDADAFGALTRRLDSAPLARLLHDFDLALENDPAPEWAWFPAWLLITAPALAPLIRETQTCNNDAPERVARLILELLALEKQGRHDELIAQRKKLRNSHAGLYALYMSSR